jgi:exonuclease SbcD
MRFLHCADIHLGARRFGSDRLTGDFSTSFKRMAEDAVRREVNAVIISGDLFDRSGGDLLTLHDAERTLRSLRDSGIEVIAIEGDHDAHGGPGSCLTALAHQGLIRMLTPPVAGERPKEWSEERKFGSYIDIDGVRIIGLGHRGEGSPHCLGRMIEAVEPAGFTVAMLHAGIDLPAVPGCGLRRSELEALREKVNYLALGHAHHRCSIDGWAYNPGGLENRRPEECALNKGYFVVHMDGSKAKVEAVDSIRRPGHIVPVDVSGLDIYAQVNRAIKAAVEARNIDPATEPIVSVDLIGRPHLDLSCYDGGICSWIIAVTGALECFINDRTQRSRALERRFEILAEARPSSSRLTPEETSDLMLRFRGETFLGMASATEIHTNPPEAKGDDAKG